MTKSVSKYYYGFHMCHANKISKTMCTLHTHNFMLWVYHIRLKNVELLYAHKPSTFALMLHNVKSLTLYFGS